MVTRSPADVCGLPSRSKTGVTGSSFVVETEVCLGTQTGNSEPDTRVQKSYGTKNSF